MNAPAGGNGPALFHRSEGSGPPVLFLNGVSMTLGAWEPAARALRERFRVVRCDLRGQLRTPGPPPRDPEGHLPDLVKLLDHQGIERAHVIGSSFGGVLGLMLARRHPERVGSIVAVTVGPGRRPALLAGVDRWRRACREVLGGGDRVAFYRSMAEDLFGRRARREQPEQLDTLARQVRRLPERWFRDLSELLASAGSIDLRPHLPEIGAPVLVVAAEEDVLVPLEDAAWLAQALPQGRLEIVPGCGHALVLERPGALARLALDFLDTEWPVTGRAY